MHKEFVPRLFIDINRKNSQEENLKPYSHSCSFYHKFLKSDTRAPKGAL